MIGFSERYGGIMIQPVLYENIIQSQNLAIQELQTAVNGMVKINKRMIDAQ